MDFYQRPREPLCTWSDVPDDIKNIIVSKLNNLDIIRFLLCRKPPMPDEKDELLLIPRGHQFNASRPDHACDEIGRSESVIRMIARWVPSPRIKCFASCLPADVADILINHQGQQIFEEAFLDHPCDAESAREYAPQIVARSKRIDLAMHAYALDDMIDIVNAVSSKVVNLVLFGVVNFQEERILPPLLESVTALLERCPDLCSFSVEAHLTVPRNAMENIVHTMRKINAVRLADRRPLLWLKRRNHDAVSPQLTPYEYIPLDIVDQKTGNGFYGLITRLELDPRDTRKMCKYFLYPSFETPKEVRCVVDAGIDWLFSKKNRQGVFGHDACKFFLRLLAVSDNLVSVFESCMKYSTRGYIREIYAAISEIEDADLLHRVDQALSHCVPSFLTDFAVFFTSAPEFKPARLPVCCRVLCDSVKTFLTKSLQSGIGNVASQVFLILWCYATYEGKEVDERFTESVNPARLLTPDMVPVLHETSIRLQEWTKTSPIGALLENEHLREMDAISCFGRPRAT